MASETDLAGAAIWCITSGWQRYGKRLCG